MVTAPRITDIEAVGSRFLAALVSRDWTGLEASFDSGVEFRALVPPGFREAKDSTSAAEYFRRWFGDADELVLAASEIEQVQDRLSISYRFQAHEDQWYVVEQRAYCDLTDGRIQRMDLLCSGFCPMTVE